MHSRIKVRTPDAQRIKKEIERQGIVKVFKHTMRRVYFKRDTGQQDMDQLETTRTVLSSNPDIYTLWNIRREILGFFSNSKCEVEMSKLYDSELSLTEQCLKMNPKSYCSWHHREWILSIRPDPNWKKELELCDIYLKLDGRNFHTWDYRRFIVSKCNASLQDEFDFTTDKLNDNFSNYSAWHYRSKMLVELYPDLEGGRPIQDSHLKHELKMVRSAAFTDPDDTSAWFYQRWLLGAVKVTIKLVACTITTSNTTLAWSKCVSKEYLDTQVQLCINNQNIVGEWVSCEGYEYDDLWILKHSYEMTTNSDVKVYHTIDNEEKQVIVCIEHQPCVYVGKSDISFQNQYSLPVVDELTEQLDSCRQLLALEPDNKWTLLTTTVILHCIDANLHHTEVMANLHALKKLDSQRAGYYDDLISKWSIEQQLPNDYTNNIDQYNIKFTEKITSIPYLHYYSFCQTVDLSNQDLTSRILPCLVKLQHCKILNLSNNKLSTLDGFPTLQLEELHLTGNDIKSEDIELFKEKHTSIKIMI